MFLKQLCNCISSQVGWHTWIKKHLGQTKEWKYGFKDSDDEECEDVEDNFAEIFRFASFCKYDLAGFCKHWSKSANMASQCCKLSQTFTIYSFAIFLQGFARIHKWTFARICKFKNHVFLQEFAMGFLLMLRPLSVLGSCLVTLSN